MHRTQEHPTHTAAPLPDNLAGHLPTNAWARSSHGYGEPPPGGLSGESRMTVDTEHPLDPVVSAMRQKIHPLIAAVHRRNADTVADILPTTVPELQAMLIAFADMQLPQRKDDGIIDEIAVRRVLDGEDGIFLRRGEQVHAARLIFLGGGTAHQVSKALRSNAETGRALFDEARNLIAYEQAQAEREAALQPCGTHAAHARHKARGEDPCEACEQAERVYQWAKKRAARGAA